MLQDKAQVLGGTPSQGHIVHHKYQWTGVGMNLCPRLKRLEKNRLSHGTAHTKYGKFENRNRQPGRDSVVRRLSEVIILA